MPDDKRKRGRADRSRVSAKEQYEVAYFAKKHGISHEEARRIIDLAGPSRAEADAEAERMKRLRILD